MSRETFVSVARVAAPATSRGQRCGGDAEGARSTSGNAMSAARAVSTKAPVTTPSHAPGRNVKSSNIQRKYHSGRAGNPPAGSAGAPSGAPWFRSVSPTTGSSQFVRGGRLDGRSGCRSKCEAMVLGRRLSLSLRTRSPLRRRPVPSPWSLPPTSRCDRSSHGHRAWCPERVVPRALQPPIGHRYHDAPRALVAVGCQRRRLCRLGLTDAELALEARFLLRPCERL